MPKVQRYGGFESGLRTRRARPSRRWTGFRLPLVVRKPGRPRVSLWGLVRPAGGKTTVIVQQPRAGKTWKTLATVTHRQPRVLVARRRSLGVQARVARPLDGAGRPKLDRRRAAQGP